LSTIASSTGSNPGSEALRAGSHPGARTCTWKWALSPITKMFDSPTFVTLPIVVREFGEV
jgi:hypothetical protein